MPLALGKLRTESIMSKLKKWLVRRADDLLGVVEGVLMTRAIPLTEEQVQKRKDDGWWYPVSEYFGVKDGLMAGIRIKSILRFDRSSMGYFWKRRQIALSIERLIAAGIVDGWEAGRRLVDMSESVRVTH